MGRYHYFRLVALLSLRLPRPLLYFAAKVLTGINWRFDRPKREAVLANLRVILGPKASDRRVRSVARLVFFNFGKFLAEFFGFERFGERFIDQQVDIIGEEHVKEALARGRGAILNTGHLSNWEIGAAAYARKGYSLTAVAQMHPEPEVNEYFRRQRASRGYSVVPTQGAYRACVEALRRNELVCFVADRDVGAGGIEVDFFGRRTLFPQGPARIALVSGAPIIPGFVVRRSDDSFAVSMEPPIGVPEGADRRGKAHAMTQEFARVTERYVRCFPAQWGVFFDVWADGGRQGHGGAAGVG